MAGEIDVTYEGIERMHARFGALLLESSAKKHDDARDEALGVETFADIQIELGFTALLGGQTGDDTTGEDPAWLPRDPSDFSGGSARELDRVAA